MGELASESYVTLALIVGLAAAYWLFLARRDQAEAITRPVISKALHRLWFSDWGLDWLYDKLFVEPLLWFARINKRDLIDSIYGAIASITELSWSLLAATENGRVRWYAAGVVIGSVVFVAIALFL